MGPSSSFSCGSLPSVSLEDGLALLDEGGDAFLRIVRHEQPVLELAFQGEARGEGFLDPFHHGTLDQAHRARRAVGEGLRVGHQVLGERLLRVDVVHEADGERLLRGEEPAGDHEVQGPARADEPGSRWVPPVPGRTPRVTSGRPILPEPAAIIRRSHARAISSPPPTQWPLMPAMTTFGVLANLFSVSWQWRQNIAL